MAPAAPTAPLDRRSPAEPGVGAHEPGAKGCGATQPPPPTPPRERGPPPEPGAGTLARGGVMANRCRFGWCSLGLRRLATSRRGELRR
mmetsp:Transcript_14954/g.42512  ORF Transcript_14954/g.42512 Transcript_14954/m.42512 type:complete len:88 (+) Transcript_14954:215-478(+)